MSSDAFFPGVTIPWLWNALLVAGDPPTNKLNALCPFHEDRTPSFSITPDKRGYHCFGCGAKGGLLKFVEEVLSYDRHAAAQRLEALNGGRRVSDYPSASTRPEPRPVKSSPKRAIAELGVTSFADLDIGADEEWETLSRLRGISLEGIQLAVQRGHLRFVRSRRKPHDLCWIVGDQRGQITEARRLDGQDFFGRFKCDSIGSGKNWPLGILEAKNYSFIVLTEGSSDFVAIHDLIDQAPDRDQIGAVCMLGAGNDIHPDAIEMLRGARIRLLTDNDKAGENATERWFTALRSVADVDQYAFSGWQTASGTPVKDVNDFLHVDPNAIKARNENERYQSILTFKPYE